MFILYMKNKNFNIDFCLISFILFLGFLYMVNYEKFTEIKDEDIKYNVIHVKNSDLRYNQILKMQKLLGKKLKLFDGILGVKIDLNKITDFDKNITFNFNYKFINEVGCYLSHFMLIKECINEPCEYSVIFEDDFIIRDSKFHDNLKETLKKIPIDFDILYLGNITENRGEHIIDNIYYPNKNEQILGTHGYLIKNKNALKILKSLYNINMPIDHKFRYAYLNKEINVLMLYPTIIEANNTIGSVIHP